MDIGRLILIIGPFIDGLAIGGLARKKYIFYLLYVLFSRVPKGMIIEYRDKGMLRDLDQIFDSIDGGSCSQIGGMVSRFIDDIGADWREEKIGRKGDLELKEVQTQLWPTLGINLILGEVPGYLLDPKISLILGGNRLRLGILRLPEFWDPIRVLNIT